MITIEILTNLLLQHLQGNLPPAGQAQLNEWLLQSARNQRLFESVTDEEQLRRLVLLYEQETADDNEAIILSKIKQQLHANSVVAPVHPLNGWRNWGKIAAAVVLAAGIGGFGYYLLNQHKKTTPVAATTQSTIIEPGKTGAVLTLADGRQVVLDSVGNGVIAMQNGTQVLLKDGAVAYDGKNTNAEVLYNNLTTPRGRQFQLLLPDGTRAWLNAASSLRYPTVFAGNERKVEVTGEVYFEVAKNAQQPFIINVANQAQVQVLGTKFNVNAYSNEMAARVTLLEGKVEVKADAGSRKSEVGSRKSDVGSQKSDVGPQTSVTLKPGEQAIVKRSPLAIDHSPLTIDHSPNIEQVMAWKSGLFNFEDASLEEVMRQVERWYDIDVVYEKNIPAIKFGGKMSNDVSLSGLLKSLQESDVHFRIEGRKLIVLP